FPRSAAPVSKSANKLSSPAAKAAAGLLLHPQPVPLPRILPLPDSSIRRCILMLCAGRAFSCAHFRGRIVHQPRPFAIVLIAIAWGLLPRTAAAHPAPSLAYDHTVLVQLTPKGVEVQYVLDVESLTVQLDL